MQHAGIRGIQSLPGTGGRAYAYAKACGIIGKSFTGKRMRSLEAVNRLFELDELIFPFASRNLPERKLLFDLEKRIIDRAVHSIISIVECLPGPPELFTLLIRSYEYSDVKITLAASHDGEKTLPAHTDIGRFQTVRFNAWPNLLAMLKGTEFDFLLDKEGVLSWELGGTALQTMLDCHYYRALWNSLFSLPKSDRCVAEKILSDEISLRNSSWALRLRTYYGMSREEVMSHLIDIPGNLPLRKRQPGPLAMDAVRSLEYPLDSFEAWSSWRWKKFLNPPLGRWDWQANPRYFQNAASRYLFHLARRNFHLHPFSLDSIFCFIKLMQFEEDILTSNAEGLGMGMSGSDILSVWRVKS